ncbi:hypothetical protein OL239_02180 [Arthrobacter sp. ATA002]|uniref:hypothetical protein n=1 Tax=Arthrobacter sp. ATA002 TaxID=2991715 RepID=UPI0022A736FA|nr:hypothetical protein [Arthrobacter sp. ATA002]WAP52144.1 hypothetical protein OL239_02180 [Arthrobacter sp. ATA002]
MRTRYLKPFVPDQLHSLGLPTDPSDTPGLAALPTTTLQSLADRVYEQLDADYPSLEAADWYNALGEALSTRADRRDALDRPA